jgi:hypothetical protein
MDEMSKLDLRRALYWTVPKGSGGRGQIKLICSSIRDWLKERGELLKDQQCGVQRKIKAKKTASKKGVPKREYKVVRLVYAREKELFRDHVKDISKVMAYCTGVKRYRPEVNNDKWYLAYSGKNLVGVMVVSGNKMEHACVAENYFNRAGIPKYTMGVLTKASRVNTVDLDKRDSSYKKNLRKFKKFGFEVKKDGDRYLTMTYKSD